MKKYTEEEFSKRIYESWEIDSDKFIVSQLLEFFIGGEIIEEWEHKKEDNEGSVFNTIIKDPDYEITMDQLCSIFDKGNHCVSHGTIEYRDNKVYVSWDNSGHL